MISKSGTATSSRSISVSRTIRVFVAFGIAHSWENLARATTTADSGRTMIHAAPEVVCLERRNTAADIWSFGGVFREMATALKGKTVQDRRNYFREQSDSSSVHENAESIGVWADSLRGRYWPSDHIAPSWALSLLQQD
ncbi:hypothetical protein J3458_001375 [Metarhizium acridum]|uniref:uncharacterized protein n=1 Tax=Metarhizium acridum TaxID=92637 RepID=UPI001C6B7051|nr:hypothetical protein J3458_001375 [Metarhizium acridum]